MQNSDGSLPTPKPRSVITTTMLVMLTVFVIVPILLMGGCAVLATIGAAVGGATS